MLFRAKNTGIVSLVHPCKPDRVHLALPEVVWCARFLNHGVAVGALRADSEEVHEALCLEAKVNFIVFVHILIRICLSLFLLTVVTEEALVQARATP